MKKYTVPVVIMFSSLIFLPLVSGDGCHVGPYSEYFYEPYQRALIAWKDGIEYMYLEVDFKYYWDVDPKNISNTTVLHIIPFPSVPAIEPASEDIFKKVIDVLKRKEKELDIFEPIYSNPMFTSSLSGYGNAVGGALIKYVRIGAHTIGVFRINSTEDLEEKISQAFTSYVGIDFHWNPSQEDLEIINHYIDRGYKYFVFDSINLSLEWKTKQPILYKFKSGKIYYPIEISFISNKRYGLSNIILYIVTKNGCAIAGNPVAEKFRREIAFLSLSKYDLESIDHDLSNFISSGYIDVYTAEYLSKNIEGDFIVYEAKNPPFNYTGYIFLTIFSVLTVFLISIYIKKAKENSNNEREGKKTLYLVKLLILTSLILYIIFKFFVIYYYSTSDLYSIRIKELIEFREIWFMFMGILFSLIVVSFMIATYFRNNPKFAVYGLLSSFSGILLSLQYIYLIPQINAIFYIVVFALNIIILLPILISELSKKFTDRYKYSLIAGVIIIAINWILFYIFECILFAVVMVIYVYRYFIGKYKDKKFLRAKLFHAISVIFLLCTILGIWLMFSHLYIDFIASFTLLSSILGFIVFISLSMSHMIAEYNENP